MARRRYSAAQKAEAIGLAAIEGQTAAAEVTGIPLSTIHSWWQKPEFAELRTKTREDVEQQFWAGIQVGLKAVVDGFADGKLGEKAVALGILYDKHALLTGGATARSEARDITGTLSDNELIAAVREAERLTGDAGAASAPAGAPED